MIIFFKTKYNSMLWFFIELSKKIVLGIIYYQTLKYRKSVTNYRCAAVRRYAQA